MPARDATESTGSRISAARNAARDALRGLDDHQIAQAVVAGLTAVADEDGLVPLGLVGSAFPLIDWDPLAADSSGNLSTREADSLVESVTGLVLLGETVTFFDAFDGDRGLVLSEGNSEVAVIGVRCGDVVVCRTEVFEAGDWGDFGSFPFGDHRAEMVTRGSAIEWVWNGGEPSDYSLAEESGCGSLEEFTMDHLATAQEVMGDSSRAEELLADMWQGNEIDGDLELATYWIIWNELMPGGPGAK